jgi:LysR family transcriptional regulator AphB
VLISPYICLSLIHIWLNLVIDLNDIALFVQIVDAGSFAGAARRTGAPSNTLSRRMKLLEDGMGVRLLHRTTRKLVLTDAGEALYERTAAQVSELTATTRQLSEGSQEPSGRVRVAAPADFFEFFQMDFFADFLARHPKVTLDFVLNDLRIDLIAEGIDLAFRAGPLPDSSLVARKVSTGCRILAASPDYVAHYASPKDVPALSGHACIRPSSPAGSTVWSLVGPEGPIQVRVNGRFCANTARSQLKAAVAGLGICLLPESILRSSLASGHLVRVLPDYNEKNNDLSILYPSGKQIPLSVTVFVAEAMAYLQQLN